MMNMKQACEIISDASRTLDAVASQLSMGEPINLASMEDIAKDCATDAMRLRQALESIRYVWGE